MTTAIENTLTTIPTDSLGRRRTPPEHREALIDLFEQSGMTGAAFARLHGIRYTTLAHWRRVRHKEQSKKEETSLSFREVDLQTPERGHRECLQLELPQGVRVRMDSPNQIPLVAALAHHLRACDPCTGGA